MKRCGVLFSAILILATVTSAQAIVAPIEASYVSFSLANVTPSINVSGVGTISQKDGTSWYFVGSSETTDSAPVYITGGEIDFLAKNQFQFTGTLSASSTPFTIYGNWEDYFSLGNASAWGSVTLTNLNVIGNSLFTVSDGAYSGSISMNTFGVGTRKRFSVDGDFSQVPIPSAVLLLASGLIGLIAVRRKKSN